MSTQQPFPNNAQNNDNSSSSDITLIEWITHPYTIATIIILFSCCLCFIFSMVWYQKLSKISRKTTPNNKIIHLASTTQSITRDRSNSVSNHTVDNIPNISNNQNGPLNPKLMSFDELPVVSPPPGVKTIDGANRRGGISANSTAQNSVANTPEPPANGDQLKSTFTNDINNINNIPIDIRPNGMINKLDTPDTININNNNNNKNSGNSPLTIAIAQKLDVSDNRPKQTGQTGQIGQIPQVTQIAAPTGAPKGPRITVHEMSDVPDIPDIDLQNEARDKAMSLNIDNIGNIGSALSLDRFNSGNSMMSGRSGMTSLSVNAINRESIDNIESGDDITIRDDISRLSRMTMVSKSKIDGNVPKDSNGDYDDVEAIYENNDLKIYNVLESKNYAKIIANANQDKGIMNNDEDQKIIQENKPYKVKLDFGAEWGADRITIPPSSRGTITSRSSMLSNNSYNTDNNNNNNSNKHIKITSSAMNSLTDIINDNEIVGSEASSGYL